MSTEENRVSIKDNSRINWMNDPKNLRDLDSINTGANLRTADAVEKLLDSSSKVPSILQKVANELEEIRSINNGLRLENEKLKRSITGLKTYIKKLKKS